MVYLPLFYFVGLVMFGIAVGSLYNLAEYAFMVIGGGLITYAAVGLLLSYLDHKG